jgi:hypothetical protein
MEFYDELLAATETERNTLLSLPLIAKGTAGDITLETYISFLTQAYHHVKHTPPLLILCSGRLPGEHKWLRNAVGEYIEEELCHQKWILNDIAVCGADRKAVSASATPETAASQAT